MQKMKKIVRAVFEQFGKEPDFGQVTGPKFAKVRYDLECIMEKSNTDISHAELA